MTGTFEVQAKNDPTIKRTVYAAFAGWISEQRATVTRPLGDEDTYFLIYEMGHWTWMHASLYKPLEKK